jgi:hypothetical protein
MTKTQKIDFRQFMNGSHKEKRVLTKDICSLPLFSLSAIPGVQIPKVAFYGLVGTVCLGGALIVLAWFEQKSLKKGELSIITPIFEGVQKVLPYVLIGVAVYFLVIKNPFLQRLL